MLEHSCRQSRRCFKKSRELLDRESWYQSGSKTPQSSDPQGIFRRDSNLKLEGESAHPDRVTSLELSGSLLPTVGCREMPTEMNRPCKATIATRTFERAAPCHRRSFLRQRICTH